MIVRQNSTDTVLLHDTLCAAKVEIYFCQHCANTEYHQEITRPICVSYYELHVSSMILTDRLPRMFQIDVKTLMFVCTQLPT